MDIGKQIRALRIRRGVTQEAMAGQLGVSAQAVSKWERGTAAPDIGMLPALSVYLGVSIDELFSLSEDARLERIQNMLWDKRELTAAEAEDARAFLLDKARREPSNGEPLALLADMENHIARSHRAAAAEHAMEALRRDHTLKHAHGELTEAMGGAADWCVREHSDLIDFYEQLIACHPSEPRPYWFLLDQLIEDGRLAEAETYLAALERIDESYRPTLCRGRIAARAGEYERAKTFYRASMELQSPPRYTDGLTSISRLCQIQGDLDGAIAAAEEEIAVLAADWGTTAGESVDQHRRRIARLREKKNG